MGEGGVEFAPEVVVSQPRYGQALGHGMDMDCVVEAYPQANVTWVRNGETLVNNTKYR